MRVDLDLQYPANSVALFSDGSTKIQIGPTRLVFSELVEETGSFDIFFGKNQNIIFS